MGDPTNNRFYREASSNENERRSELAMSQASRDPRWPRPYRDEFNTTSNAEDGYRAAVRLATVLMNKHWPEAKGWHPAPDLLGVITQLDHITAHLFGCFAGSVPEPIVSMPPAADGGAPCALADRVGTSAAFIPACTCHPDDRSAGECPRQYAASECNRVRRRSRHDPVAEAEARKLYDSWSNQPGWVPWVERGNSLMQERARRETWT